MKKITAFFLAFLPLFIIVLLFITGMLIKNYTHVFVSAVEFTESKVMMEWDLDPQTHEQVENPLHQMHVNVLPFNATTPDVYYRSTDENVVTIDDKGLITAKNFGEASIYAVSKENETLFAKCDIEVWDDEVHRIDYDEYATQYVTLNDSVYLNARPVPSTHIEGDLSLNYESSSPDVVEVAPDGEITGLAPNDSSTITVSIDGYPWATQDFDVQVGYGVTAMEFDQPENETISDKTYDLFNHFVSYPEKTTRDKPESQYFTPTDFTYDIISNNDIADVDDKGLLTFKQPGKVSVEVTCKRNTDVSIKKDIESTFEGYTDVSFNRYSIEDDYADYEGKDIEWSELNWQTFPALRKNNDVTINSSNQNVVEVIPGTTQPPRLKVTGAGSTILTASAPKGDGTEVIDVCYVNFTKPITESFIKQPHVDFSGAYNYYLRNNVNPEILNNPHQKIEWSIIEGSDYAKIDPSEPEIIHFAQSGVAVTVQAVTPNSEPRTFTITCHNSTSPIETIVIAEGAQIKLQTGHRYIFQDSFGRLWSPPEGESCFYEGTDSYIARHGAPQQSATFTRWDMPLDPINVNLIITEDPIDISFEPSNIVSVVNDVTVHYSSIAHVVPSTATDENGNSITLPTEFTPENEDAVSIQGNDLTFNQATNVLAISTFNDQQYPFLIINNLKDFGKFGLVDESGETIYSGTTIQLGEGISYYLDIHQEQTADLVDKFKIESRNGNELVNSLITWDEGSSRVKFTITPKKNAFGKDTIVIKSGTFNFYLNVKLEESKISNFIVSFNGQQLVDDEQGNTNISYTNNLKLNVVATPLSELSEDSYIAEINGEAVDIDFDSGIVDLSGKLQQGEEGNTLVLTSKDGYSQTFKISYSNPPEDLDFSVLGSYEKGSDTYIPIACGATQKTLVIVPSGGALVDSTLFSKFAISLTSSEPGPQPIIDSHPNGRGKAYIQHLPTPTTENKGAYEATLSISYNNQPAKEFKLSRELVSKIELPNHDNNSLADQKGLQKVHVYGDKSMYDVKEGLLDYYKLPINLYDYKGELIEDDPKVPGDRAKENAFKTLIVESSDSSNLEYQYHQVDETTDTFNKTDFIEIHFVGNLYDEMDIYENNFIREINKNVNISFSTPTQLAHADYTFVPVSGINAYCQEALKDDNGKPLQKVLQTNFGLGPEVQDNAPLTDTSIVQLTTIYGNGYTINFSALNNQGNDEYPIYSQNVFNATIQGCLDSEIDHAHVSIKSSSSSHTVPKRYYRYNTIKNTQYGFNLWGDQESHITDCLLYNNSLSSIVVSEQDGMVTKAYVEDCILFNCSSTAFLTTAAAKIYFKGFVDLYNFKGREILKNLPFDIGDLTFLWPALEAAASTVGALHRTASGRTAINSAYISANIDSAYFWDGQQYVQSGKGLPTAFNFLVPYFDLPVEIQGMKPGLWATKAPTSAPGAPSYYDQFDGEGNLRWDFLNNQLVKIMRPWSPLPYTVAMH